ncbi:hypothetical protein [Hymenobacter rubripertinctus]|uniref:hypothetical protein n=1 Tax=Hymenobacter rubripertinctus TaxID=2029981 RepID=UPI0036D3390B
MLVPLTGPAQPALGIEALDTLVVALNTQSTAVLEPYLRADTRIDQLPAAYTALVLAQLVARALPVEDARLVRQGAEEENTRYACSFARAGVWKEYNFLLDSTGQFLELNLAKAHVKKIAPQLPAQNLTLPERVTMPFRLVSGLVVVTASVDGRRGDFVLDTGCPTLRLNNAYFAPPAGQQTLVGGGSTGIGGLVGGASFYQIGEFDWQGIVGRHLEVATFDLTTLEAGLGQQPILGLIGYSLLSQYALTLDYQQKQLWLDKPPPVAAGSAVAEGTFSFLQRGHLPVVAFRAGGQTLRLGIDSGAQNNLLDEKYASVLAPVTRRWQTCTVVGLDATPGRVLRGELSAIELGPHLVFKRQPTVFATTEHLNRNAPQTPLDGLAGYPLLRKYVTTIDYVHKTIRWASSGQRTGGGGG